MKKKDWLIVKDLKDSATEFKERAILDYLDSLEDLDKLSVRDILAGALERVDHHFLKRGIEVYGVSSRNGKNCTLSLWHQ